MYRSDYKVEKPEFNNNKILLSDLEVKEGEISVEAARINAKAINDAIERLSAEGGGTLVIPAGVWAVVPIRLLSDVNLEIQKQAMLKFVKTKEDYPLIITNYEGQECIRAVSPITAQNAKNVAITGEGVIDGSGDLWRPVKKFKTTEKQWKALLKLNNDVLETKETSIWMPSKTSYDGNIKNIQGTDEDKLEAAREYYDFYRPVMISLRYCTNVLLQGVTFMNSPAWNIHPFFCENLTVEAIKVKNPYHAQNGDGIDVESCTNVHIFNSIFETGDDAICIKSGKNAIARKITGPCSNIYIHDCTVLEGHGGFVIGSEMSRGVRDILVENCTFLGTDVGIRMKSAMGRGGVVENITIKDVRMINIKNEGVILTMGYVLNLLDKNETIAMEDEDDIPYFKNMTMDNIEFINCNTDIKIEPIQNRENTISNIVINKKKYC